MLFSSANIVFMQGSMFIRIFTNLFAGRTLALQAWPRFFCHGLLRVWELVNVRVSSLSMLALARGLHTASNCYVRSV